MSLVVEGETHHESKAECTLEGLEEINGELRT